MYVVLIDGDYHVGPYIVRFPPRTSVVYFRIPIMNDNIVETSENFTVIVNASLLPSGIYIGDGIQTTIIIANDDCK